MWTITDKNGVSKAVVKKLEYNGHYKGERFLAVTVESPAPITFVPGDLLTYRGETWTLTTIPAAVRQARSDSVGNAVVYEDLRFNSTQYELEETHFTDLVLNDNYTHYTALGSFSFYVSSVRDFGNRVQACLNEKYGTNVWSVAYGSGVINKEKDFSVESGTSVWNALVQFCNDFEVEMDVTGRTITLGWDQTSTTPLYSYGKGNGLKKLTQSINADQAIITRVKGYGSTRNLPYRYYNQIDSTIESMYVPQLMLPGFPTMSLQDWYDSRTSDPTDPLYWRLVALTDYQFSDERTRPYIISPNRTKFGYRDGEVIMDGSADEWEEIYPSIVGMTTDETGIPSVTWQSGGRVDLVLADSAVEDNGVSASGVYKEDELDTDGAVMTMKFNLRIPNPGFNPFTSAAEGETPMLEMTSGLCTSEHGQFEILGAAAAGGDVSNGYVLTLNRAYDSNINMAFPNSRFKVSGGDSFIITGISMPTIYIEAASIRLFFQTCEWLALHDHEEATYQPEIDDIFMAENPTYASELKEGMLFRFTDSGLDMGGAVTISQLSIKEGDSLIPHYEVTLSDEVEASLKDAIDDRVRGLSKSNTSMFGLNEHQIQYLVKQYGKDNFLSKVTDDVAAGNITFQQGVNILGTAILSGDIKSDDFVSGLMGGTGWRIDSDGNGELESLRVRTLLEVVELLINRMQAQEGDTLFSDNDQIEAVAQYVDPTDQSVSYVLDLKEKWDGYVTAQQYGNVIKGIINTLAANEAGVADVDVRDCEKDGKNAYFTSWMRVIATNDEDSNLGLNQIRVVLYGDNDVPSGKNFAPCQMMNIARWGCVDYSDPTDPNYEDVKANIERRQRLIYISNSDGRIVKLTGVDKPKLEDYNYGTTLGILPEFVQTNPQISQELEEGKDYLYAQGVVVERFIKVDINGHPEVQYIDKGEWVNNTEYLYNEYNQTTGQWETHDVWHDGVKWRCLQHQPVTSGGTQTYYEPKWNSPYWQMIEGNENLDLRFNSSRGYSFRRGYVNTTITPLIFYGNIDISADIASHYWWWERSSEDGSTTPQDATWNAQHNGIRIITLTDNDMPLGWSSANKAVFTCYVTVNDGQSSQIVSNQIIA